MKEEIMHDPWTERLSEYLDGELTAAEAAALDAHLAGCAACRGVLEELRTVTAIAAGAVAPPPADDLWPGIAARIGAEARVLPLAPRRPRARFSFTMPQLAAAAVVLMAVSGGAVWLATSSGDVPGVVATAPESGAERGALPVSNSSVRAYDDAITELEQALAANRSQLDTATVRVLERSIATIDRAIEDARAAVARDPANPYLHRHLDGAMKKKLDILRTAVTARRAGA